MTVAFIHEQFDKTLFLEEMLGLIDKFAGNNPFANAEVIACLASLFLHMVKQAAPNEKAVQFILNNIINEAFSSSLEKDFN